MSLEICSSIIRKDIQEKASLQMYLSFLESANGNDVVIKFGRKGENSPHSY
jgi:hypothetical protein